MPSVLLLIPLFEILGLLGFVYSAALLGGQEIRYLPLVVAAGLVVWVAIRNGRKLTPGRMGLASVLVSLAFVGGFQVLGLVFPGLAKDIDVLSVANLVRLGTIAAIAVTGHAGLFAAVRYLRWK